MNKSWTCYHCDETFTDRALAAEHFGISRAQDPGCIIDIAGYRRMEKRDIANRNEDTELHRALAAKQCEMNRAVIRSEEDGYTRGMRDANRIQNEVTMTTETKYVDVVFDGPPSHESGRFIELENDQGCSIRYGEWVHRADGYWVLRLPVHDGMYDVQAFQQKFSIPMPYTPQLLARAAERFRQDFLLEEVGEFVEACGASDLPKAADALVDLVYVAYGTALMMGLGRIWPQLWAEVQRANMSKVRAAVDGSDSKRRSSLDVIKPPGWVGPDLKSIIDKVTAKQWDDLDSYGPSA